MKKLINYLIKVLFPEDFKCIFCGSDISNFEEKPYCENCEKILPLNNKHKCIICSQPILNEATVCDFCQGKQRPYKKIFSPLLYEGIAKKAILAYKSSNKRYLAKGFAKLITEEIIESKVKLDVITYIPMTLKKEKSRSFNQSKLLAEEISKILKIPVISYFKKNKEIKEQKSLNFSQRYSNIIGSYSLKPAKFNKEHSVLLVDDIITTTATIAYTSGLLLPKVNQIYACSIARVFYHKNNHVI